MLESICQTTPACKWVVELRNKVWIDTYVPHGWHHALVSGIFEEGDATVCDNYCGDAYGPLDEMSDCKSASSFRAVLLKSSTKIRNQDLRCCNIHVI